MSNLDKQNLGRRWYVVHTITGYENKVKTYLQKIVDNRKLGDYIFDIQIPTVMETLVNEKGKEKVVETKLFPNYVYIEMIMSDDLWHIVRSITGVTGFVGPGSEPTPLSDAEVEALLFAKPAPAREFKVGDKATVINGSFMNYSGTITEFSEDKSEVKLMLSVGTRDILITISVSDIKFAD